MTWSRLRALRRIWDLAPPTHIGLARILEMFGGRPKAAAPKRAVNAPEDMRRLMEALPQGRPEQVMSMADYQQRKRSG